MTKVRLLDDKGEIAHVIDVPDEQSRELGRAGDITFRGRSYRFTNQLADGFVFEPSGPTFLIREEWLVE